MAKKFSPKEDITTQSLAKSSAQRGIRASVLETYPGLEPVIEDILPKKTNIIVVKCREQMSLLSVDSEILFFQLGDGPFVPTLKLLHKYPTMMPQVQVDRGAIKFVLSGANIMCPGMTSPGGRLPDELATNTVVAVMAEGKQHALAIGMMLMSSKEIRSTNKGHGIENLHFLGDGLFRYVPDKPETS